jgi:nicotinamide-nucleotide amidase
MSAEIICVGTELLLGDIVNTNAQYLAQQLAALGIPHYYQSVVGDNPQRIEQVINTAIQRASLLIFTGGLGPTSDDLTTESIAAFFGSPLEENAEVLADIAGKFRQRGQEMVPSNRKQALIPQGAVVLPNPLGTAPGMIWQPRQGVTLLTFPGVPSEMKRMWQETAIPFLRSQGWGKTIIHSKMLRFRGIGESALAEKVSHLLNLSNPTVAPYASLGEVRLRVAAQSNSLQEAEAVIAPVAAEIRAIAGLDYYGEDEESLSFVVGSLLRQHQETVSVAESCTGGGIGQMLTEVAGSSDYFQGGVIAYDNRVKVNLLGVKKADLSKFGAVSAIVAEQMASGVRKELDTDWGLSITGIAGPGGGSGEKPVGLVYVGLAYREQKPKSYEFRLGTSRDRTTIRYLSGCIALDQLRRRLLTKN